MKKESVLLILTAICSGCAVGPDYVTPDVTPPSTFAEATAVTEVSTESVTEGWWTNFSDPQLELLVNDAIAGNNDLQAAVARINQARALKRQAQFELFPIVTSSGGYAKSHNGVGGGFGGGGLGTGGSVGGFDSETYDAGFNAVWELDFFGRVRRGIEARSADSEATVADLQDVMRILVSEVARNYIQLRGTQSRIAVARENARTQEQVVHVAEVLFNGGQTTEFDVVRAKAQLLNTRSIIPGFEASAKAAIFRLAVLSGKQPSQLTEQLLPVKELPKYKGPVALGDPASLIRRRPDIRAAERRLAASTARIGVSRGDLFPKVTFTGSISVLSQDINGFGADSGEAWNFGPGISWAAFDLGRVYAQVDASEAATIEALAKYRSSILTALEDVEGALSRFSSSRQRRDYLHASVEQNTKAVEISRTQYENGLVDLLPVLDAQRSLLATQDQLAESETDLMTSLVAVFKALGGGWEGVEVRGVEAAESAAG